MARKLTEQEKLDWSELYNYVRSSVMNYDSNQSLPSTMVLRLKGLLYGKFMENLKQEDKANYSYKVVLNTFKFCNPKIQSVVRTKNFNNEMQKFNYILKIVESNLNDVYMRMKSSEKAKEKIEKVDMTIATYSGASYKKKEKTKDKFNDLW